MADALVIASHKVGDTATAADACHHASAESGELAEALLDVYGSQVAESQCPYQFFLSVFVFDGIHHNGICGTDALVAAAAVAHHRNHSSSHTGIACRGCLGNDMREDAVAEDAFGEWTVDGFAEVVTVVAEDGIVGGLHVVFLGLEDEADFFQWGLGGEVMHHL